MSAAVRSSMVVLVALVCMASLVHALVPINGAAGTDRRKSFKVADVSYALDDDSVDVSVIDDSQIIAGNSTGEMTITQMSSVQTAITTTTNGIIWRGGTLLNSAPQIYLIFYGNFAGSTTPQIMIDLAQNQGSAPLHTVSRSYWTKAKPVGSTAFSYTFIDSAPTYGGAYYDTSYAYGTTLTEASTLNIITAAAKKSAFGSTSLLSNAVYFVITSADVAASGMCTKFCGWHTAAKVGTAVVRYSYIGSPMRCPSSCSRSFSVYPNDNREADGMANIFMHELVEAVTSPDLGTWSDASYLENADKCAWKFGTTYTTPNGATANCKLGNRHYLIQQNWLNYAGGSCQSSWSG